MNGAVLVLGLAPGAGLRRESSGLWMGGSRLGELPPGVSEALQLLEKGASEPALVAAAEVGGPWAIASLHLMLARLARAGLLHYFVLGPSGPWATFIPTSPDFSLPPAVFGPGTRLRLSRFSYLRADGGAMVLENPLAQGRLLLAGGAAPLVFSLSQPRTVQELVAGGPEPEREGACALMGLLLRAGFLVEVDEHGESAQEREPSLGLWEFHDLLFHTRSRPGRHGQRVGGSYRLAERFQPPPVVRPLSAASLVELHRPEEERLQREDPPLAVAMARRRSSRAPGMRPPTAAQLGELLFRSARILQLVPGARGEQLSLRPSPSGGGLFPLELYPVVRCCEGLEPALYHYEPMGHRLERIRGVSAQVERLLEGARMDAGLPHVLLVLAARFQRVSWKYESMAYATVLKDAGAMIQTLYLACAAMGLRGCALGSGAPGVFAAAAGTQEHAESSVAEFVLGGPL